MKIVCEACSAKYSIADDKVRGKVFKIRCKKCSHIIVVRGDEGAERQSVPSGVPAPEVAASSSADVAAPQWYVVIDGEQVGPLSAEDVAARVAAGQVGPESYAWTEGMADWAQVANIPDLAAALRGRAQRAPTPAATAPSEEDNPFAPQATVAMPASHVEDMFGQSAAARAPAADLFAPQHADTGEDAFNAAPTAIAQPGFAARGFAAAATAAGPSPIAARGGGGGLFAAAPAAAPEPERAPAAVPAGAMTGQRSENSVLFSLSNLEALAAPKAAAAPAGTGGGFASPASEGSGLIDIRAMAQVSLGKPSLDAGMGLGGGGPVMSDLPSFAATPLSPVVAPLLPGAAASSGGVPKWVVGVIAAGVLVIGGMGFAIYRISTQTPVVVAPPVEVPALPPPAPAEPVVAAAPAAAPAATAPGRPEESPPVAVAPAEAPTAAAKKPAAGAASAGKKPAAAPAAKPSSAPTPSVAAAAPAASPAPSAPAKKSDAKTDSLDDLLAGALGGKKPASGGGGGSSAPAAAPEQKLGPLQKSDIVKVMTSVMPKTKECYDKYKVPGIANVNIKVEGSGKVSQADVTGKFAGTPSGDCVEAAIKSAKFPASDGGMTFPYPIPLR